MKTFKVNAADYERGEIECTASEKRGKKRVSVLGISGVRKGTEN